MAHQAFYKQPIQVSYQYTVYREFFVLRNFGENDVSNMSVADSRGGGVWGGVEGPPPPGSASQKKIIVKFMRVKRRKGTGHRALCSFCPFCIPPVVVN